MSSDILHAPIFNITFDNTSISPIIKLLSYTNSTTLRTTLKIPKYGEV